MFFGKTASANVGSEDIKVATTMAITLSGVVFIDNSFSVFVIVNFQQPEIGGFNITSASAVPKSK
jgi:hypothetical protein